MNVMDVIYILDNKAAAIYKVFTIDQDLHLLNTQVNDGEVTSPTDWNSYWRMSTKASGGEMYNTRFNMQDYITLLNEGVPGMTILVAGYPADDVETMLASGKTGFITKSYDENNDPVETLVDLTLTDEETGDKLDHRVAPIMDAQAIYRSYHPESVTVEDPDGNEFQQIQGNFSYHGV